MNKALMYRREESHINVINNINKKGKATHEVAFEIITNPPDSPINAKLLYRSGFSLNLIRE
jgi:hypothetical protein